MGHTEKIVMKSFFIVRYTLITILALYLLVLVLIIVKE
jgi:hypothetical protein